MSVNDLISRSHFDERVRLAAGPDADEEFSADFLDGVKTVLYMLSTEQAVSQEMSVAEESRLRVPWRWLEDFAREYKGEQHAEFVLAAKRAYISSVEKMYGQWAREHTEERSEECQDL